MTSWSYHSCHFLQRICLRCRRNMLDHRNRRYEVKCGVSKRQALSKSDNKRTFQSTGRGSLHHALGGIDSRRPKASLRVPAQPPTSPTSNIKHQSIAGELTLLQSLVPGTFLADQLWR